MRPLACFAILSFLACRGAEPDTASQNTGDSTEASKPDQVSAPGPADTSAPAVPVPPDTSAPAVPVPPERERRPVRLIEHRGDATSPVTYRVVEPDDATATTPIVLALHGRGDTAAGFMGLARRLELEARVVVTEAPLPFGNIGGRQWFDTPTPEAMRPRLDDLEALLGRLAVQYPDAGKPVLLGFSQGAMLAMLAVAERPERFRAAIALSGRLVEGVNGVAEASTPILVVAGTKDGIIPQEASWTAADKLVALGRSVERFSFVGAHSVPPSAIEAVRLFFAKIVVTH